ncbi:hypothetical protein [Paludisphaera rhizosphaerae]|uniref:hypothetical protein n=1 Tax=Paludisphaera rhizosphaerae TaxID=2711216 RepID=UPI0013ECAED6|nr:hypothetical protein [Paludisphaera rhizosphaerae]
MRFAVRSVLLAFAVVVGVACYITLTEHETGEHVASVSWLPEEATDVTYSRSYGLTEAEFRIPEPAFLAWARKRGWDLKPIEHAITVPTAFGLTSHNPAVALARAPANVQDQLQEAYQDWLSKAEVRVHDGWQAEYRQDNGGGYRVVYARKTGRAHYRTSPR